jgi:hypothetical protein
VPEGFIPFGRVVAAGTHAVTLAGEGIAPAGWNPFAG